MKKIFTLLLLGGLLLLGVQKAWAGAGFFEAYIEYSYNSTTGSKSCTSSDTETTPLGELTADFKLTGIYLKYWKDAYGNMCGGLVEYYINSDEEHQPKWTWTDLGGNDHQLGSTAEWTVAKYNEGNSGNYTFWYRFKTWGSSSSGDGCGTNYYIPTNGTSKNKFTYTIMPPAVSGFAVAGSGDDIIGGDGTIDNPYIIRNGGSLTLTASGAPARNDDTKSTYYVKFGTDDPITEDFSKEISGITSTTKTSITVKAYCENSTDELTGTESTQTIYYKAGEKYSLSITSAGWASLYLGYPVDIPAGVSVYTAGVQNGEWVTLNSVSDVIPANTGVIVKGSGTNYFYQNGSTASSIGSLFEGVLESTSVTANTVYVLSPASTTDACVFSLYTGTTLGANKVYIDKNNLDPQTFVPSIRFIFEEGNNTTGVENIESTENAVMFFENGQLRIRRNGVVYDITGKMVK